MTLRLGLLGAAVLAVAGLSSGVRADRLDRQLNDHMPDLVEQLKKSYKTVGVLRFRVQDGTKMTFDSPLSGRLAERVENLLVLNGGPDEDKALGVIHDAGAAAHRQGVKAWYTNSTDRKKLFDIQYLLAWGSRKVKPDVFLTGKVVLSKDRKKTTVTLETFDRSNPTRLTTLGTYTIDTDRFVLRDLGYSFVMSRGSKVQLRSVSKKRSTTLKDEDELLLEDITSQQGKQRQPGEKEGPQRTQGDVQVVQPGNVAGIRVELLVNGKEMGFRESGAEGQKAIPWLVDSPDPGSEIAFRLTNTTARRLGVVLRLNGVSTINEQTDDPENGAKWIIAAGRSYLIRGFYRLPGAAQPRGPKPIRRDEQPAIPEQPAAPQAPKTQLLPFRVLVGAGALKMKEEMGDIVGVIDVDVFAEGEQKAEEMLVSSKGLPPSKEKEARSSYVALRSALLKSSKLKTVVEVVTRDDLVIKRELIVPDDTQIRDGGVLRVVDFPNPQFAGRLSVRVAPSAMPPDLD